MKFISEEIIDKNIESIKDENPDGFIKHLSEDQPAFIQFIATENFKLLTDEEFDTLIFLLSVIWKSATDLQPLEEIDAQTVDENDEKNWAVVNELGNKNFGKVLDHYFENYPQEDLLAFVEDSLAGEESHISQVGKELLFITSKTFIDCLHRQ